MIFDCFSFFNELDLLEIRLNYLDKYVDKFVLVEMGKTHSGHDKPFFFEENKNRYAQFLDKIIHIKITEYPDSAGFSDYDRNWQLENYQRDCIMLGLKNAKPDDIIITSDLDEIPSHYAIEQYSSGIMSLNQKMMYYYLNNINVNDPNWTKGTKICRYSDLIDTSIYVPNQFGMVYTKPGMPTYLRFYAKSAPLQNGGWHFSYLGSKSNIAYKIKSFSHQELNNEIFTNEKNIEKNIMEGKDIFNRNYSYKPIKLDNSFPDYIVKNQDKYKHLILDV